MTCDRQLLPPGENHRIIAPATDYNPTRRAMVPGLRNCFAYLIFGSVANRACVGLRPGSPAPMQHRGDFEDPLHDKRPEYPANHAVGAGVEFGERHAEITLGRLI